MLLRLGQNETVPKVHLSASIRTASFQCFWESLVQSPDIKIPLPELLLRLTGAFHVKKRSEAQSIMCNFFLIDFIFFI
jgi:hypothetical protein